MNRYLVMVFAAVIVLCGCEDDSDSPVSGNPALIRAQVNFSGVNSAVAAVPVEAEASVDSLAAYIDTLGYDEPDKAYFVFRWIQANVQYDDVQFNQLYIAPETQTPEAVFASRLAVCTGYAALFRHMVGLLNLNANQIDGYGVPSSYSAGTPYVNYQHVWNGLDIDGEWYLVDLTWAPSSSFDGSSDPSFFFLADPSDFARRHQPYDEQWQLMAVPVERTVFWDNLSYE